MGKIKKTRVREKVKGLRTERRGYIRGVSGQTGHNKQDSPLGTSILNKVSKVMIIFTSLITLLNTFNQLQAPVVYASNTNDAVANMQINAGGDEKVTGDVINKWYESTTRKTGRLAGKGGKIVEVADKYGINRAFFVALMDAETTSGVNACFGNDYNFGCVRAYTKGTNVDDGLEYLGNELVSYIEGTINNEMPKNPTIKDLTNTYAPAFENDHPSRYEHHGAVFGYLGVDADEMQKSGKLKNGKDASKPDYSVDGEEKRTLASSCPTNCDLAENQKVNDNGSGANTGNLKYLPKGERWKKADNLLETDLGYTSDQTTKDTLEKYLDNILKGKDNKEMAEIFYEAGKASGLDPRFLVAFWSVNTVSGTSEAWEKAYNAFGWSTGGNFSNAREGIVEGAKLIAINYYNDGQSTLSKMVEDKSGHIVSADEDWANAIVAIMKTSEDAIGSSVGKIPDDATTVGEDGWVSEQCSGNGTTGLELTGKNYTEQTINFLKEEGFTNESIAGILGNMQKESGISPTRIQGHSMEKSEEMSDAERDKALAGKVNGAYAAGIVQWESERFGAVRATASEMGVSPYSMEPQMKILIKELKGMKAGSYGSGTLYDFYKSTNDIAKATSAFAQLFERCAACHPGTGEFEERTGLAKELYATYF